jgi:hypothetical protein
MDFLFKFIHGSDCTALSALIASRGSGFSHCFDGSYMVSF